jgi:hypothetical protein
MTDMTKDQATEKVAALRADPAWLARYLAGSPAEQKEFSDLNKIAFAPSSAAPEPNPKIEAQDVIKALRGDPEWSARYLRGGANEAAELTALNKAAYGEVAEQK